MKSLLAALVLLLASGCASLDKNYAAYLAGTQSVAVANAEAHKARALAIAKSAEGGGEGARTAAMFALAMMPMPQVHVAPPPENEWMALTKAIFPPLAYLTGIYISSDAAKHSATMSRDVAISSNQAFASMGNSIATAGAAGYPFVQAPQPNQTFSGTGVWGSGTYTATTNTNSNNRTCNGGTGGVPSVGTTTTGGAGGSADC